MGLVTWFVTQIQWNVNICELHCLRFQNFMISNFNATVLAFLGCFGWQHMVGDFLCLSKYGWLLSCLWREAVLQSLSVFYAPRKCYLLRINSCAFYAFWVFFIFLFFYFVSSWKQTKIAYWYFVAVFMTVLVLSASVALEHRRHSLYLNLCSIEVKGIV
jgi:hypothetical protein